MEDQANHPDELNAILAYYELLGQQARRAEVPALEVPPVSELEVVDGWVTWKGRPVWCSETGLLVGSQPKARAEEWPLAESAWIATLEQRMEPLKAVNRAAPLPDAAGVNAELDYYESLAEQARYAMRGKAPIPDVPARSELRFMDGWLVWKGQPVWWSGHRPRAESTAARAPAASALEPPPAPARERPKLRRLLALPWRRAAA